MISIAFQCMLLPQHLFIACSQGRFDYILLRSQSKLIYLDLLRTKFRCMSVIATINLAYYQHLKIWSNEGQTLKDSSPRARAGWIYHSINFNCVKAARQFIWRGIEIAAITYKIVRAFQRYMVTILKATATKILEVLVHVWFWWIHTDILAYIFAHLSIWLCVQQETNQI